jgi:TRAP-type mannitol/chloroaromatic compound transport system permease large subunit
MLKIIFLLLMSGGIPVAIAMAGSALMYVMWSGNLPAFVVIHRMISGIDSFPLLAVPFFILAGNLMNNAGITNASTTSRWRWWVGSRAGWATSTSSAR